MRALLFAAGKGERMLPLTARVPKPLLQIRGRALIEWRLQALATAGIREVVINVSWLGAQIRTALGDGSRHGVAIAWSEEGPEPLETAGGMRMALPLLGDAPFVAMAADIWTDFPLARLPATPAGLAHLVLVPTPADKRGGPDFSLDATHRCRRGVPSPDLTFSGIGVYRPELVAGIRPGERMALRPLLLAAAERGELAGEAYTGVWHDVGTPATLAALDQPGSPR